MIKTKRIFPFILLVLLLGSCSHHYDSNTLDLSFYQWNLWPDTQASLHNSIPSCGWDVLHRGNGKLVRIPATVNEHFQDDEGQASGIRGDYAGVSWFHCRFTLPELWEDQQIVLRFEKAGPGVAVYLNENLVGDHNGMDHAFEFDISEQVYYTRDNHLAVRITDPNGEGGGITGNLTVVSSEKTRVE
jgi:hypothetical protein